MACAAAMLGVLTNPALPAQTMMPESSARKAAHPRRQHRQADGAPVILRSCRAGRDREAAASFSGPGCRTDGRQRCATSRDALKGWIVPIMSFISRSHNTVAGARWRSSLTGSPACLGSINWWDPGEGEWVCLEYGKRASLRAKSKVMSKNFCAHS